MRSAVNAALGTECVQVICVEWPPSPLGLCHELSLCRPTWELLCCKIWIFLLAWSLFPNYYF